MKKYDVHWRRKGKMMADVANNGSGREAKEKKAYTIQHLVRWYFANYCMRKCFDKDLRLQEHYKWLMLFAEKNPSLQMTHKEFLHLFNDQMHLCTLHDSFKRRSIGWGLFEDLKDTPNYDSDKIIVQNGRIKRIDGELEKPVVCIACKALGIR